MIRKIFLFVWVSVLTVPAYSSSYPLVGETNVWPGIVYFYFPDRPTSIDALPDWADNKGIWVVVNGKIKDENGAFSLTTKEVDDYYAGIDVKWEGDPNIGLNGTVMLFSDRGAYLSSMSVSIASSTCVINDVMSSADYESPYVILRNVVLDADMALDVNGFFSVDIQPGFIAKKGSTLRIYNEPPIPYRPSFAVNAASGFGFPALQQNRPNPFTDETVIDYFIPQSAHNAYIQINNVSSGLTRYISIEEKGNSSITLQKDGFAVGTYIYSLFVDGELVDAKQMFVH